MPIIGPTGQEMDPAAMDSATMGTLPPDAFAGASAADMARQGSAYKVYGCGLMFNRNMTRVNIIVPLTSMTVMPY